MPGENNRPRVKIELSAFDRLTEAACILFLIILIALPVVSIGTLPEKIPVHFNAGGEPNDFGDRNTLFLLPAIGLFLYLTLTILSFFPHLFNYPVQITAENARVQYRLAVKLIRILKTVIVALFTFLCWMTIKTASGESQGLGKLFLPLFLTLTFGTVLVYFIRSMKVEKD